MARTILDLFESKILTSGETAKQTYAVRNSKDLKITTNSPILNVIATPPVNTLRQTFGVRKEETLIEEELTGLRPLRLVSSPYIYGTEILRITQQRTAQTEAMKNGDSGSDGILGNVLNQARVIVRDTLRKVGVKLPHDLNPTSIFDQLEIKNKSKTPEVLAKIRRDSAGNIAGKVLTQGATPPQIKQAVIGEAINFIKSSARGILFGSRSTTRFAKSVRDIDPRFTTVHYGSDIFTPGRPNLKTGTMDAEGSKYSKGFILQTAEDNQSSIILETSLENLKIRTINQGIKKLRDGGDDFTIKYVNDFAEKEAELSFPTEKARFDTDGETASEFVGLANKVPALVLPQKEKRPDGRKLYSQMLSEVSLEAVRGMTTGNTIEGIPQKNSTSDAINRSGILNTSEGPVITADKTRSLELEGFDFVPLKFTLIHTSKTIHFRSIIDGLSETFSPGWDSAKFLGNPFNYYTYTGIERSVSFNLKVAALNSDELKANWDRLSFLASMVYPAGYETDVNYMVPPFIKFTLGDMYRNRESFIESLTYTVEDNMGWEIGMNEEMKNYKLPKMINVSLGIKFLESRTNTADYKSLYSYKSIT